MQNQKIMFYKYTQMSLIKSHNSAKTFAITTKIGTKLLNGYKLKVNKNGVQAVSIFVKI